jgi:hypothetical protein
LARRPLALERLDLSGRLLAQLRCPPGPAGPPDREADRHARDALLHLTERNEIVIDPFLGSGSTLIAAEKTGRVCQGVELDPLYVDLIVRRFQAAAGLTATLVGTGETFQVLGAPASSRGGICCRARITVTLLFARDLGLLLCSWSPTRP